MKRWCDAMVLQLSKFGTVPYLQGDHWQPWAIATLNFTGLTKYNPPNPLLFADWQEWASRFNQAVQL
jgi:hypothetical protein